MNTHQWLATRRWIKATAFTLLMVSVAGVGIAPTPLFAANVAQTQSTLPTIGKLAVVGSDGTQLHGQPQGEVVSSFTTGTTLTALARSQDGEWIFVKSSANQEGWAPLDGLILFGSEALPVHSSEAANESTKSPEPTQLVPTSTMTPTGVTDVLTSTLSTSVSPVATPAESMAFVKAGGAKLLSAPNGSLIRNARTGESLTVLARSADGGWLVVQTRDQVSGWVESSHLIAVNLTRLAVIEAQGSASKPTEVTAEPIGKEATNATTPLSTVKVTLTDARLNVRSGPGTAYAVVTQVQPGAVLTVIGRSSGGGWYQVNLPGQLQSGWVSSQFVSEQ